MPAFDNLPRASFSGAEFPVEAVRVKGGIRYHVHEYPHIAGGDLEKLGRRLYEIEMKATFQDVFTSWPGLWPGRLALLRSLFEAQTTATLVIPTIGGIKACCIEWDQEMLAKMRSGETTTFRFIEDQESAFAFANIVKVKTESLPALSDAVSVQFDKIGIDRTLTDQIVNAVDAVLAIFDQAELFQQQIAAKIELVASLCREFDKRIEELQHPENWLALDAMKDLWFAVQELAKDSDASGVTFGYYEVRRAMTITDVAIAIYGSTERAVEILQLNAIDDPFNVPPGTRVRYALPTDQQAAA